MSVVSWLFFGYARCLGLLCTLGIPMACSASGGGSEAEGGAGQSAASGGRGGSIAGGGSTSKAGSLAQAGASGNAGSTGISTGGASGAGGAFGGSGGAGLGPCSAAGLLLCDDFEGATLNARPSSAPWLALGPECGDATYVAKVDGAQAKSGSQSLLSQGAKGSNQACALMADIGMLSDFWVRTQVRFGAGATFTAHEVTVFELGETKSDDPEVRVGFRGDNSCNPTGVELAMTKGLQGEATGCTGFNLVPETWYCFEVHVVKLADKLTGELYIDGAEQPYKLHGQDVQLIEGQPMVPKFLRVGLQTYSSDYSTTPLHLDDIAVGTERIPCN